MANDYDMKAQNFKREEELFWGHWFMQLSHVSFPKLGKVEPLCLHLA